MQRIYEPENLMEGEMLKGMLASEGIEAHLIGRDLLGGTGECRSSVCWACLWITIRPIRP